MTTTYDPFDPAYWDEGDLRQEMDRVFDLCHGCRLCFKFCTAFPTLFEFIDRDPNQESSTMSDAEQDQVVDECFNCKLCGELNCPYTPGKHEWALDFPRLMLRAEAVRNRNRKKTAVKAIATEQFLGRTDFLGKVATKTPGLVNRLTGKPGSASRKLMEKTVGIASERLLPPYAKQRFSTWFKQRARLRFERRQGNVALFSTCLVEYQDPQVGKDTVRVFERNGIECSLPEGQVCCGAPWLHAGDVDSFRRQAEKNVKVLADAVRSGRDVVVPEPTCSFVIKKDYPDYVGGADADLVAANTYDAAEYLMRVHKGDGTSLDTDFAGTVPEAVTYHAPCHLRAQNIGLKSRDLMKLTGSKITVVAQCSGIDGTWGYRAENYEASRGIGGKLGTALQKAGNDVIAGDCSLANGGILQETGTAPMHPLSFVARAYGIPEED
jgi:glycerol-3-phosphate dehydrogenase subunit C